MLKSELQNYLDKNFPELRFIVRDSNVQYRTYVINFTTDVHVLFDNMCKFDNELKHNFLYLIEEMLYSKLGLLNKAVDDIRELRRKII